MERPALTVGCNQPLPPLIEEVAGRPEGLEPDIVRAVCAEIRREPSWLYRPWPDLPDLLDAGEFDCLMLNLCVTPERARRFALSRPYGGTDMAVLTRSDTAVRSLADLRGLAVGAVRATTNLAQVEALEGLGGVRVYDPGLKVMGTMIEDLAAGEIDAALDDEVPLRAIAARVPGLAVACTIPTGNRYAIAFRRSDASLRDAVDLALGRLVAAGELARMFERWTGLPLPEDVADA